MANHVSHAALPFIVKGARYTIAVPYLDADGDPTDPTTPDTERSIDGAAFADCAEEVTTISGSNGVGYLTLTGAETDCSLLAVAAKVASGPKNTLLMGSPRVLPVLYSGTSPAGSTSTIRLASDVPAVEGLLIGCIVKTTGGTGGGGTGGANNQARVITGYTSGRTCTVTPDWETATSSDTTYEILLTEMASKVGYKLASDGLDLVVPADPSAIPVLGTASIVSWIGFFGLWTVGEVNSDADSVNLRNSADTLDLASYAISDNGVTFQSAEPT